MGYNLLKAEKLVKKYGERTVVSDVDVQVKRGEVVISIHTRPEFYLQARDALRKASMKLPTPCTTKVVKGAETLKGLV